MSSRDSELLPKLALSELADIRLGHPFRGTIPECEDGDVNVVQVRNTDPTGSIHKNGIMKTSLRTKKTPEWLKNGDVLFVAKGAKHFSVLVENVQERTVCSPHFFIVRIKAKYQQAISPHFLCWQLNQQPAQRYFKATAEGSMYLSIRRQVLENTPIKLLSREKQDQLTELNRCAIRELKVLEYLIQNRQTQLDAIAIHALESNQHTL